LTITSILKADTARSQVLVACWDHRYTNSDVGNNIRKAQTANARMCRCREGLCEALRDISKGLTILCTKWRRAVNSKQKLRHKRTKRFSGSRPVRPVCRARI